MKKFLFGLLLALFAFSSSVHAQEQKGTAYLKFTKGKEVSTIKFNTIGDFEKNADATIEQMLRQATTANACEVTIEISITVDVGLGSVTVTGSVTAPCGSILAAAKKLRAQLLDIALGR